MYDEPVIETLLLLYLYIEMNIQYAMCHSSYDCIHGICTRPSKKSC